MPSRFLFFPLWESFFAGSWQELLGEIHLGLLYALEVSRCGLGACGDPMLMNWGCHL
jgi:hypothetical protein